MLFSILIAFAYAVLIFVYSCGWKLTPITAFQKDFFPKKPLSILIPARNEAENIEACLRSILSGSYPFNLLEIIVIDDFSSDETVQIVQQLSGSLSLPESSITCIRLADLLPPARQFTPNKKQGITLAVAQAKGQIIVTTDADCIAPKNWLMHLAAAFENDQTQMICAPVAFHREKNFLQRFQSLDFSGLMGITIGGAQLGWHYMANGANLAYQKHVFQAVGGYSGNEHLASGDDMFLVQKIVRQYPGGVAYLKNLEATVLTEAAPDFRAFWRQRLRWGTKNSAIPNWPLRLSLLVVLLFCWSIWINLGMAIAAALSGNFSNTFWIFLFQVVLKALFDYFFLSEMCRFFKRQDLLRWFFPSFILHTAYIAVLGAASIFFKNYNWKARNAH